MANSNNNENTPLLNNSNKASSSSSPPHNYNNNTSKHPEVDPTALYVKVINEQLPWYKRPSVLWLLPIFGMTWVTNGMLASSQGQFQAALLCREYLNRHTSNMTTTLLASEGVSSLLTAAAASVSLSSSSLSGSTAIAFQSVSECEAPEIQAYTAKMLALIEVIGGIASTFSIGYYSSLSDKYGRKIIMILGFLNSLLVLGTFVLMSVYWDQIGLPLMIVSGLVNGLLGGTNLGTTMTLAYTADCTDPAQRSLAFSWIHAALYLGLAIGPFLGGMITTATGTILTVVFIDIAVTALSLLITVFFMPESLPSTQPEHLRRLYSPNVSKKGDSSSSSDDNDSGAASARRAAWHSHALQALRFFKPNGRNTNLVLLAAISFLQMLAFRGTLSVIILYTNRVFHWKEKEDGIMFSLSSTTRLVTMLIILPLLVHFYQKSVSKKQKRVAVAAAEAEEALWKSGNQANVQSPTYGSNSSSGHASREQQKDAFDRNQWSPTLHDESILDGRADVVNSQTVFNPNDPTVAASLQFLGETALELAADHIDDEDDEDEFSNRRRRQASVDSLATLTSTSKAPRGSPRPNHERQQTTTTTANATEEPSMANVRTKEQTFSDMKFDTWMIRLGFAINSITYVGYGLARETWQFYLATSLHAICIISSPSLKSLLTSLVEPSQFGAALGALQVVDSIAAIFSPIVISWVYALTVSTVPEFVWYSCALWTGICVILAFMIRQKQFRQNMPGV
ncbi:hypothetical protein BGX29_011534 [Mortierella sp. GBA35]|nr:hypothetical protein BGX29_011534 [Mortierella sp. GBA35]